MSYFNSFNFTIILYKICSQALLWRSIGPCWLSRNERIVFNFSSISSMYWQNFFSCNCHSNLKEWIVYYSSHSNKIQLIHFFHLEKFRKMLQYCCMAIFHSGSKFPSRNSWVHFHQCFLNIIFHRCFGTSTRFILQGKITRPIFFKPTLYFSIFHSILSKCLVYIVPKPGYAKNKSITKIGRDKVTHFISFDVPYRPT